MIMPGVQKPHWKPCAARKAAWTGWNVAGSASSGRHGPARPSMVVTLRPAARKAGIRQLCTGSPSRWTVQAPQSPASQPFLTPNQPASRR